jgi:PAS domain S-box-containing protein
MADSLGVSPELAVGMKCYEIVHHSSAPLLNCPHAMLLKDGKEHAEEVHEDNLGGDFLVTTSPLYDSDGGLMGSVHIARDITKRKQAEEEIRKARDFYLKVLDDFPNPIWRADVQGKCDYFNRNWFEFTGRTPEQELGDGWAEGVHPDDLERCLKIYLENFHACKPF